MMVCRRRESHIRQQESGHFTLLLSFLAGRILADVTLLSSVLFLVWIAPSAWAQSGIEDVHIQPRAQQSIGNQTVASLAVPESVSKPMKVNVDLVLVPITIMDSMNRLVKGLDRNNFEVYEGKSQQEIRYFSSEDAPVSIGIILDLSGSMKDKLDRACEGIRGFLSTANPQDEFFMITFSDKPEEVSDFTQQAQDIQEKLAYTSAKGRTALLDAIYLGMSKMRQAKYERRALLIISDGGDNNSRYTEREITSLVKEADVMIYSVGIYDHNFPTPEELLGPELLLNISGVTGGWAFSIDNPNQLSEVAKAVGIMLRNQYLLGYRPASVSRDGKWHKIKIKLKRPRLLKLPGVFHVYAKSGYYAPAE